ncbi:MAG TPA: hypothetical protein VJJ52_00700 [Candidatus Nanoarchaeia archaeon]|nr:hypothetical protein [Candidatus Nanoarchaeia archaeon]
MKIERIPNDIIIERWSKIPYYIRSNLPGWNYPAYISQNLLYSYQEKSRSFFVVVIFPFDDLSQLGDKTVSITQLTDSYNRKYGKNCLQQVSYLVAQSVFKALEIISHDRFLIPFSNNIYFQNCGYMASHDGASLILNYDLFTNIVKFLVNKNIGLLKEELDYLVTQIAHELTHKTEDVHDYREEFDNFMYGVSIYEDGICRFTEYITSNLLFDHGFSNELEDAQKYLELKKEGYHNPLNKRYFLGLYICLTIFLAYLKKREEFFFLKEFVNMDFENQMKYLRNFRREIKKIHLEKQFLKYGQIVRADLLGLHNIDNLIRLFRQAELELNIKITLTRI